MRLFLYELQPVDLERDGLVSILNQRLTAVEGRADVKARLLTDETISLPLDKEVALYYIAQEALNNVLKHAKAKSVTVRLKQTKSNVKLEIEDDGYGFVPSRDCSGGMGMKNMRERASQVGGKLAITSVPGKGTKICATVSKDRQSRIHLSGAQI
jgi:signal transduction histidine kinase